MHADQKDLRMPAGYHCSFSMFYMCAMIEIVNELLPMYCMVAVVAARTRTSSHILRPRSTATVQRLNWFPTARRRTRS